MQFHAILLVALAGTSAANPLASVTTSTTPSSSAVTPAAKPVAAPSGWAYRGCYQENQHGQRIVGNGMPVSGGAANMTIEACLALCQSKGFTLAGLEYGQECYCGTSLRHSGACFPANKQATACNTPCRGSSAEKCGGSYAVSVFQSSWVKPGLKDCQGVVTTQVKAPQTVADKSWNSTLQA